MNNKKIYVYFDHRSHGNAPLLLGTLTAQFARGKENFVFEFDADYLKNQAGNFFDPELQFYSGPQFTTKPNFGIFTDSAPDRWGRRLMSRREAIRAAKCAERPRIFNESDFLLGVYDQTRMGALRFKLTEDGPFLNDDSAMSAPPWARLRELEEASRHIDDATSQTDHEKWLSILLAPGSSLGGARPKASVTAEDGSLWIAKFPAHNDTSNIAAWEYITMQMARECQLNVPEFKLENFSKYGSTFLVKRFDRDFQQRIHFASAMTLLGKSDGAGSDSGDSYLELAEFITQYGENSDADLLELWKRIVFSIAVSNTDDHLRNHGFLLTNKGWILSPAYDLNPNPAGQGLSLNINEYNNSLDFSLALEVAPWFRVSNEVAHGILKHIQEVTSNWRSFAQRVGIGRQAQDSMQTAFNY